VVPELGLEAVVKRCLISQPMEASNVLATTVGLRLGATLIAAAGLGLATWLWVDMRTRRIKVEPEHAEAVYHCINFMMSMRLPGDPLFRATRQYWRSTVRAGSRTLIGG
jgi:hypothetical protein